jgi:hypothetical protein
MTAGGQGNEMRLWPKSNAGYLQAPTGSAQRAAGCGAVSGTHGAGQRVDSWRRAGRTALDAGKDRCWLSFVRAAEGKNEGFQERYRRLSRGCGGLAYPTPFVWHRGRDQQHYVIKPSGRGQRRHPCAAALQARCKQGAAHH